MLIVRVRLCLCLCLVPSTTFYMPHDFRQYEASAVVSVCSFIRGLVNFYSQTTATIAKVIFALREWKKDDHSKNINAFALMHAMMIYTTAWATYNATLPRSASVTTSTIYVQCKYFFSFIFQLNIFQHTGESIKPHIHFIFFLSVLFFIYFFFFIRIFIFRKWIFITYL